MCITQHEHRWRSARNGTIALILLIQAVLAQAAWAGSWQQVTSPTVPAYHLNGIWGTAPGNVYAVGAAGSILHWNGSAWSLMSSPTSQELFGIWGSAADNIYAVGAAGTIVHYNGSAWSTMTSHATVVLKRIWGSGPSDIWTVGTGSTILHFDGSTWTNLNKSIAGDLNAVWGSAPGDVYAVDDRARILHYNGSDWSVTNSAAGLLYGIWGTAANNIYAAGWDGTLGMILHFNGTTWSPMTANTPAVLADIWGSGPSDIYAVGTDYTGGGNSPVILHFDGTAWSAMSSPVAISPQAVWGSAANDVYLVSYQGTILYNGTARAMGSIAIDAATYTANRYIGFASIAITRTGSSVAGATVDYTTGNGTGVAGTDYRTTSGTLTFGLNETTKYVMVDILPSVTAGTTFTLSISNPGGGASLGSPSSTTVTIVDGGTPPTLSVEHQTSSSNAILFQVRLSRAVDWEVMADYATANGTAVAGADYAQTAGTLVILPGDTISTISVGLIADADLAAGRTFTMTLRNPYGATLATAQATGTIEGSTSGTAGGCGIGVGPANMVIFYTLCWVGLAALKWSPRRR